MILTPGWRVPVRHVQRKPKLFYQVCAVSIAKGRPMQNRCVVVHFADIHAHMTIRTQCEILNKRSHSIYIRQALRAHVLAKTRRTMQPRPHMQGTGWYVGDNNDRFVSACSSWSNEPPVTLCRLDHSYRMNRSIVAIAMTSLCLFNERVRQVFF